MGCIHAHQISTKKYDSLKYQRHQHKKQHLGLVTKSVFSKDTIMFSKKRQVDIPTLTSGYVKIAIENGRS